MPSKLSLQFNTTFEIPDGKPSDVRAFGPAITAACAHFTKALGSELGATLTKDTVTVNLTQPRPKK